MRDRAAAAPDEPRAGVRRRTVLKAGAVGAAALGVTGLPRPASAAGAVFRHGVASGDPLGDAVVLWTRVTPDDAATPGSGKGPAVAVDWEVAADPAFRQVVRRGTVRTDASRDHTVNVDVAGLTPYTRYHYRFTALGQTSPAGLTQTAGTDGVHALRLGFVSCSNWTGGYFSAYRHLAARDDLDVVLHLGDYVYEYGNAGDRYGPASLVGKRDHVPAKEMTTLADYRQRHAQYKTDPDLQAAHARTPWIVIFDDHEVANDSWSGGAENHQAGEGDFLARRRAAYQAYLEWMPIRMPDQSVAHRGIRFFRRFSFGPLADLSVIDTRQNRSEPVAGLSGALFGVETQALNDPERVFMEPEQMQWLTDGLKAKSAQWHLIGNQTVFTRVSFGKDLPGRDSLSRLGLGATTVNTDQWDGYQDDQLQVLQAMAEAGGDPVVLTGDIHSAWANDVPLDSGSYVPVEPANNSVAVEFVCPSVTSDGFAEVTGSPAGGEALVRGIQAGNPHVRYIDGVYHGFSVLDVTPEAVQCDFFSISDREDPRATVRHEASWRSAAGTRSLVQAAAPVGARSDRPRSAARASAPTPTRPPAAAAAPVARDQLPATGGTLAAAGALAAGAALVAARARATDDLREPREDLPARP